MLRKLLKYDMQAVWRVWWLLLVILPPLSLISGVLTSAVGQIPDDSDLIFVDLFLGLFLYLDYFVLIGVIILTEILIFARFYKHFYTDEGYLTFTLPVKRSTLFLSKTLNAMIWNVLNAALLLLSFGLFSLFLPKEAPNSFVLSLSITVREIWELLGSFFSELGGWSVIYLILGLLILALSALFSINLMHLCITVGSVLVSRGKLILSIGIYYGATSALSSVVTLLSIFTALPFGAAFAVMVSDFEPFRIHLSISLMLLIVSAFLAGINAILYCMTLNKIEQKLNLP